MMREEGLEAIFARHARLQGATRAAMKALNLPLFAADDVASPAVTAVMPQGVEAEQAQDLRTERGFSRLHDPPGCCHPPYQGGQGGS
jgi:aspartate aminotransferase-like enzyme